MSETVFSNHITKIASVEYTNNIVEISVKRRRTFHPESNDAWLDGLIEPLSFELPLPLVRSTNIMVNAPVVFDDGTPAPLIPVLIRSCA